MLTQAKFVDNSEVIAQKNDPAAFSDHFCFCNSATGLPVTTVRWHRVQQLAAVARWRAALTIIGLSWMEPDAEEMSCNIYTSLM